MHPPANAYWSDGWWRYVPPLAPLSEVKLANSSFAPGYTVCWDEECRKLDAIVPVRQIVTIKAVDCAAALIGLAH
jgi:hypothetical protein